MKALMLACMALIAGCHPVTETSSASEAKTGSQPGAAQHLTAYPLAARQKTPGAPFTTAQGDSITLQRFSNHVVVLHLWATWCQPCVHEMPALNKLSAEMPSVEIVPVSVDLHAEKAATFLMQQRLAHLGLYHDPDGQLMREVGAHGVPMSYVIDRQGRIAAVIKGSGDWNSPALRTFLAGV